MVDISGMFAVGIFESPISFLLVDIKLYKYECITTYISLVSYNKIVMYVLVHKDHN